MTTHSALRLSFALNDDGTPLVMPGGSAGLLADFDTRRAAYVPEWRARDDGDAGVALARVWSAQAGLAIERLQLLPDKLVREALSVAGVSPAPQRAARAMLEVSADMKKLTAPLALPAGFQFSSARADGEKGDVIWETEEELSLAPVELVEAYVFDGETMRQVEPGASFYPLGERPSQGAALYLGFAAGGLPGSQLSIGLVPTDDGASASAGGLRPAERPLPVLRWESLDPARGYVRADVVADGSALMSGEGIVKLAIRPGWAPDRPPALPDGERLLWIRARLVSGGFRKAPRLQALVPQAVFASARRTWRDISARVEHDAMGSFVRLGKQQIEPGSVVLEAVNPITGRPESWHEVPTLAGQTATALVFSLDPASGVLRFGEGREGAMLPDGLRYVTVRALATVAGAESAVAENAIDKPLRRLPGLAGGRNPFAAVGGSSLEDEAAAIRRGPATVKARGRAVTAADVAALALEAEGANITRAYAMAGVDATLDGALRPGSIGVFVIPARRASDPAEDPPAATSSELGAVASHISANVGPALARVTVGSPAFVRIKIGTSLICRQGADLGKTAGLVEAMLTRWLDPEKGPNAWQLGDTIGHSQLLRLIIASSPDIVSVEYLTIGAEGKSQLDCSDVVLGRFDLPWPDRHEVRASYADDAR